MPSPAPAVRAQPARVRSPGFSVVIPSYRCAQYIEPTLEAVAAQTLLPNEVLIYEDGHFDDLRERVAAFAARAPFAVHLLGSPVNQGVSRARNRLLQECRSEFVAFLDADDVWSPDHLANAAALLQTGADVVFCGVTFIDPQGRPLPGRSEPSAEQLHEIAAALFRYNFVQCTSTLSMRWSWLERVGDFDPALSHGEDLDLWLRLLEAGAVFRYSGHCTCAYRKHPTSAMATTLRMVEGMGAFFEKHRRNAVIPRADRRRALISNHWSQARLHWRQRPAKSAASLARLWQLRPWNPFYAAAWSAMRLRAAFVR